jgi:hypothetical protein
MYEPPGQIPSIWAATKYPATHIRVNLWKTGSGESHDSSRVSSAIKREFPPLSINNLGREFAHKARKCSGIKCENQSFFAHIVRMLEHHIFKDEIAFRWHFLACAALRKETSDEVNKFVSTDSGNLLKDCFVSCQMRFSIGRTGLNNGETYWPAVPYLPAGT